MKKFLPFMFVAATLVCFSCAETPQGGIEKEEGVESFVTVNPIITRATATNFENGDRIGLEIKFQEGEVFAANAVLQYSEEEQAFIGDQKWYADGGVACDLKAFYPYSADGFPSEFTVASDQSRGSGASDFMVAFKTKVYPQRNAVTMPFKHYLSRIRIIIDNAAGAEVESVVLKGLCPTADIAFEDGEVVVTARKEAGTADIKAEVNTAGEEYTAIIVPQNAAFKMSINLKGGASLVSNIPESLMKQGYSYTVNAELTPDNVSAVISGEIENWEDGGEISGGTPSEGGELIEFEEHDGYFIYHDQQYKTVTLANGSVWMAEPMAWLPKGVKASSDPTDLEAPVLYPYELINHRVDTNYNSSGAVTGYKLNGEPKVIKDAEGIKRLGYLYSVSAYLGAELTEENFSTFENAQGICPDGWHVPSRDDWFELIGATLACYGEAGSMSDPAALFYNKDYDGAKVQSLIDAGFESMIVGCRQITTAGSYAFLSLSEYNSTVTGWYGLPSMTYFASSTAKSSTQFMAVATTFTLAKYPEGRLSIMNAKNATAMQLRCVKNAPAAQ